MNTLINIDGNDYPFHFGMRVFWYVTNSGEIEFDQVDGRINSDYDSFLEIFLRANQSAIRKGTSQEPNELDKNTLEFAIDDDPDLMFELQEAFQNSSVVEKLEEQAEEEGNEKKPSD